MKILRFEITDKCNQKCNMCWSTEWQHKDMNWNEVENIIEEYARLEPNGVVVLTSREPLLSSHFKGTLELCTRLNLDIKILTNGTLLNDNNCKLIIENNVSFVGISLHGNRESHDEIVNVPDSYDRTIIGIEKLNKYKEEYHKKDLDIRITTTVSDKLINSINEIITIAGQLKTNLRIQHIMFHPNDIKEKHKQSILKEFNIIDDIIDGFPSNTNISATDVQSIIAHAKTECKDKNVDLQVYPDFDDSELYNWYDGIEQQNMKDKYCDHVSTSVRVRANGDVTLCQYIDKTFGNLRENTIEEIIYLNNEYHIISQELLDGKLFPICSKCCHCRNKEIKCETTNNYKI